MSTNSDKNIFSLEGKTALVTGASRGLGQAIAVGLAQAGADVICCSSREGGVDETAVLIRALGRKAYTLAADLSKPEAVRSLVEQAYAKVNSIDVLVNNGGTIARHPAVDFPLDEWQQVIDVNLNSVFLLSQLIGKNMVENKQGKIINIASMLSFQGGITVPAYTASKHGVVGLTKALANEWAGSNVQVNAIAPGYFRTDNTQALQDNPERNQDIEKRIPAGQWGEPAQLVGAVTFLSAQASDYVNGHVLAVDGGWLAR
ncbi:MULTISPECIES: 2-dehydro-3-deoxy-D-gluconate 5-dehydrogenase KduD [Colwelliaceae]|uniref:2-deoxy-D-gluconate 3-dehydrogenase n=1 Tax=Colwellia psychrerythraea TaxID=28229 RepID=A0A099KF96_COLPS|nr:MULTISPECIES: 2-dehydro-3-deoxy-D-gluconate 5-dehydrogenase KduD [Colwelliaceae]KGJ88293.1 2-deoxy-D-gluconate 3-dehydrogenase [Colwellia psychrerythraea]KGJ92100.1 2-deoxy-D-gluconate 3-dehydrogenase [Thalassotalea sp. ND16A]